MQTSVDALMSAAARLDVNQLELLQNFTEVEKGTRREPKELAHFGLMSGGGNRPRQMINVRVENSYIGAILASAVGLATMSWDSKLEFVASILAVGTAVMAFTQSFGDRESTLFAAMIDASGRRAMKIGKTAEAVKLANDELIERGHSPISPVEASAIMKNFEHIRLINLWPTEFMVCDRVLFAADRI